MKRAQAEAAAAAEKEARKLAKETQLKQEEEELAAMKKTRGSDKVAVRRAAKHAEAEEALGRIGAPSLEARSIEAAIAVMSVATGDPTAARAGAGSAADDDHAADLDRVSKLAAAESGGPSLKVDDKHPERRMKAAWLRYYERELPLIREEFKSLKLSQHKDMLWRKWQKSPENPMVAAEKAGSALSK